MFILFLLPLSLLMLKCEPHLPIMSAPVHTQPINLHTSFRREGNERWEGSNPVKYCQYKIEMNSTAITKKQRLSFLPNTKHDPEFWQDHLVGPLGKGLCDWNHKEAPFIPQSAHYQVREHRGSSPGQGAAQAETWCQPVRGFDLFGEAGPSYYDC